jgi:hypothetical protein
LSLLGFAHSHAPFNRVRLLGTFVSCFRILSSPMGRDSLQY